MHSNLSFAGKAVGIDLFEYQRMDSKESTLRDYELLFSTFSEKFGMREIESITTDEILSFLKEKTEGNKPSTKNRLPNAPFFLFGLRFHGGFRRPSASAAADGTRADEEKPHLAIENEFGRRQRPPPNPMRIKNRIILIPSPFSIWSQVPAARTSFSSPHPGFLRRFEGRCRIFSWSPVL